MCFLLQFVFACFLALAAAKPLVSVAYTAPIAAAYTAPVTAAYTAPLAYSAYSAPIAAYSAYPYASPYAAYYLRWKNHIGLNSIWQEYAYNI